MGIYMGAIHYNKEWQGEVGSMFHSNCQIKKDLGNYADNHDKYIQAFIQTYDFAQVTQMGDEFYLQWAPMSQVSRNEGIEMPQISTGAQAVPQEDPH
jgi:hypothetical protein